MKICTSCHEKKAFGEFNRHNKNRDGYQDRCRDCSKQWYLDNKESHKRNVAFRTGSRDRFCECGQEFFGRYRKCPQCIYKARRNACPVCEKPKSYDSTVCQNCFIPRSGEDNPNWKNGRTTHSKGYLLIRLPDRGYVFEHILVMEDHLDRRLFPGENVHHLNGIRHDNRIENLELWTNPQPSGIRAKDALSWAKEMIARYDGAAI